VFDHVTIRASDRGASERFYDTVLSTLGIERTHAGDDFAEWDDTFSLYEATASEPVTRGLHIAFAASSRALVDEFWRAGTGAGYRDDGAPGLRPQYTDEYYGGFLLDPDGNSVEAARHETTPAGGIDHMWIRVADVDAAARFYESVAPYGGFRVGTPGPGRRPFIGGSRSFSLVHGRPTERLHMAFPVAEDASVDAFHRELTEAGYRDNGGPGERAHYHPGYYAAFVLDPDGNNIEVVNHNR
jgi:catechol 2,3-dioxygenase-like lactoylglutathione lyase family enzyme